MNTTRAPVVKLSRRRDTFGPIKRSRMKHGSARWIEHKYGISKTQQWKWKLMASIPKDLFEMLIEGDPVPTTECFVTIARLLRGDRIPGNYHVCPSCGETVALKNRIDMPAEYVDIINQWMASSYAPSQGQSDEQ